MERRFRVSETKWVIPLYQEVQMDWTLPHESNQFISTLTLFHSALGFLHPRWRRISAINSTLNKNQWDHWEGNADPSYRTQNSWLMKSSLLLMRCFFHPMCWNDHCWIGICSEFLRYLKSWGILPWVLSPKASYLGLGSKVGKFNDSPGSTDLSSSSTGNFWNHNIHVYIYIYARCMFLAPTMVWPE